VNATQLEALVLEAVGRAQSKAAIEDDRIEFKRDWPGPNKARQLAAAANRAGGDWLIYVIGVDEADGSIHSASTLDPAMWWAKMESSFDEVAPELVRHLNVQVTDTDSVVGLLFRTDRTPYVVKVANGGATEREVPIRVGTRTRSAHRHELLRLLLPSASVPRLASLGAYLTAGSPDYIGGDSETTIHVQLRFQIYFEHLTGQRTFLPLHLARADLTGGAFQESAPIFYSRATNPPVINFGVTLRGDGIELSGPGSADVQARWKYPREKLGELATVDEWRLRLEFGVAGSERNAVIETRLVGRTEEADQTLASVQQFAIRYNWRDLAAR
jgi:hypothetical protein